MVTARICSPQAGQASGVWSLTEWTVIAGESRLESIPVTFATDRANGKIGAVSDSRPASGPGHSAVRRGTSNDCARSAAPLLLQLFFGLCLV